MDRLAAIGAERAIAAAAASDDELLHGTYAWVLLHQGRLAESEQLAAAVASSPHSPRPPRMSPHGATS